VCFEDSTNFFFVESPRECNRHTPKHSANCEFPLVAHFIS
jgi:hypothetical protein